MHVSAVVNSFAFNPFKFTVAKKLHLAAMLSILAKPTSPYSTLSLSIFSSIELGRESDSNVKSGEGGGERAQRAMKRREAGIMGKKFYPAVLHQASRAAPRELAMRVQLSPARAASIAISLEPSRCLSRRVQAASPHLEVESSLSSAASCAHRLFHQSDL